MEKPQGGETEPHEHLWDEGIREAYSPESTSDRPVSVTAILENIHGVSPRVRLHDMARQGPSLPDPPGRSGSGSIQDGSRYEFLGEIAKGGVGVVYKGRDRDLGREVALKVLLPDHAGRADLVERFVEEAQVGGQLQHPGIVPVFGLELQPDGRPYFAMKLIEGMTLAACLAEREDPARDRRRFLRIFEQLCQAVAYAHTRGVVHRDLKPLNVMVGSFGEVQVVDWGMAKVLGREDHDPHANEKPERLRTVRSGSGSSGSLEGSIMGTPSYLPPEQARGEVEKTDRRCDVFALGAMLLELLTGRPPYSLDTREALKQAAKADLADAYAALDTCSDDRHLTSLCRSCLSLKRSARPSDAGVVASRITQHLVAAEERARKAEIRARESRVRAAEERRARRLTLAVTAAMSESGEHLMAAGLAPVLDLGPWSAALDCARRAEELARAGGATKDLLEKAAAHLADVEKRLQEARATAERKRRDDAQSARLQRLRMDRHSAPDLRMTHHLYAQAFRGYGIDVDKLPPSQAAEQIAGCAIASDLVTAIDEWTWIRRRIGGNGDAIAARLRVIAQAADADPTRKHVRDMSEDASTDRLREIARDGGTDGESEWPLARVLGYRGEHEAAA
ncbi:MAG: serine/threonine-protein kinase, partial [Planctomycetota bacterium]